jgi:inorganic phosphate transporter, PiT family
MCHAVPVTVRRGCEDDVQLSLSLRRTEEGPGVGSFTGLLVRYEVDGTRYTGRHVVLATGAVGSPVSMTQAVSGALVGTASTGARVRWREAARLVGAWAATLPAAGVLAGVLAVGARTLA